MPTPEEIAQVAVYHANHAKDPIISFGQGCEGDPVLASDSIAPAIELIRGKCPELTINFNSNCSVPERVKRVIEAGADSIRVSLNSVIPSTYNAYYRPTNYTFDDVCRSIEIANEKKIYVALNLLTMPGVNDRKSETDALIAFLDKYHIDLIQTRNLNIDAELLYSSLNLPNDELLSIKNMLRLIKKKHPHIKFGYFNRMKRDFYQDRGLPDLKIKKFKK
jgi:molybdenum cofactor biosynthesis enzyme MoaA